MQKLFRKNINYFEKRKIISLLRLCFLLVLFISIIFLKIISFITKISLTVKILVNVILEILANDEITSLPERIILLKERKSERDRERMRVLKYNRKSCKLILV